MKHKRPSNKKCLFIYIQGKTSNYKTDRNEFFLKRVTDDKQVVNDWKTNFVTN